MRAAHPAAHRILEDLLECAVAVIGRRQKTAHFPGFGKIGAMPMEYLVVIIFIETTVGMPGLFTRCAGELRQACHGALMMAHHGSRDHPVESLAPLRKPLPQQASLCLPVGRQLIVIAAAKRCLTVPHQKNLSHDLRRISRCVKLR